MDKFEVNQEQVEADMTKIVEGECSDQLKQLVMSQQLMMSYQSGKNMSPEMSHMHQQNVQAAGMMLERCLSEKYCAYEHSNYVETVQRVSDELREKYGDEKLQNDPSLQIEVDEQQKDNIRRAVMLIGNCLKSHFPAMFATADTME